MRASLLIAVAAVGMTSQALGQLVEAPAELKKLEWMVGDWSSSVKWTMPGMPEMDSNMSVKIAWDGPFLKATSTMEMQAMKFTETQYMWWDAGKKKYASHTFTSFAATPRVEYATLDGNKFVSTSEPWDVGMAGGPTTGRTTFTKKSDSEFAFVLEFKNGDAWGKVAEGTFKKK
jgi:hypothetical protein